MKALLSTILLSLALITAQGAAIGSWNTFLAYSDITEIEPAGKLVYVLSSKGLFSYNTKDQSVDTYDKINALNDVNIEHIAYCKAAHRLVIVYENQNIDLLDDQGNVVNISDYYNKSMTTKKTVNEVKIIGTDAYLSTGFGILRVNVADAEISATYNLGKNVASAIVFNNEVYAATTDGILKASTTTNLLDKGNWTQESTLVIDHLYNLNGQLMAINNGAIYLRDHDDWTKLYDRHYHFCSFTGGKLIVGQKRNIWVLDTPRNLKVIPHGDYDAKAFAYDATNDCYWSHESDHQLYSLQLDGTTIVPQLTNIQPDGPKYNYFGFMRYTNQQLYSCGGGWDSFSELLREGTTQIYKDQTWTICQDDIKKEVNNSFVDMLCVDADPASPQHVMVGSRTGLYEYLDGKFIKYYSPLNSPLEYALDEELLDYILVTGVTYDKEGNLWCLNSQAKTASILQMAHDGTWTSHHTQILMDDNNRSLGNMKSLIIDSRGLLWFVNNHWALPSFYCYDPVNKGINYYQTFVNEDGTTLKVTGVRCIAEDKDGNMWVGTNVGPLMLPAESLSEGSNAVLNQVKVPRNDGTNFADYLLSGVDVTCIAIDGAGRKWFGTNGNGAYLISEDNMTQVEHFMPSNSNILSTNIESIAINDATGEVFFGTDNGLCSYMSDATATNESMDKDNVYAYPNPVRPDYTGLITVTGLSFDADVKIVTTSGVLVYEGRSNGGSFTWNGCDQDGKRVASGVYMVETATSEGKKGTVCKIAIVK